MSDRSKPSQTLNEADIAVSRPKGRRTVLGLMAAGATLGIPTAAQAADGDNGAWRDGASCPRGPGGGSTGLTDADTGSISDASGRGRGAPRC